MKTNGGFLVTKIKQLGDRIFEKILSEKNIDAFNGPHFLLPLFIFPKTIGSGAEVFSFLRFFIKAENMSQSPLQPAR